jgi:hypothetical protein
MTGLVYHDIYLEHDTGRHPECAERLRIVSMAPPKRTPCRRLFRRMTVLADGTVPSCEDDIAAGQVVGDARPAGIAALWCGDRFEDLRRAHLNGDLNEWPLCAPCDEWHRP